MVFYNCTNPFRTASDYVSNALTETSPSSREISKITLENSASSFVSFALLCLEYRSQMTSSSYNSCERQVCDI